MPPKRDSSSSSVEDLIIALKDDRVLEAIGTVFENKLQLVLKQVGELKQQNESQKREITELKAELKKSNEKLEQLEAYNRLDNLVISGLPAVSYTDAVQTGDDGGSVANGMLEQEVIRLFNSLSMEKPILESDISVAHRLKQHIPNKPAPVIVRFTNRKAKDAVYRARRQLKPLPGRDANTHIYINEDLTKTTADLFRRARELRRQRKIFSAWTFKGVLYIKRSADASCRPEKITQISNLPT